jgi:hypothetical protein
MTTLDDKARAEARANQEARDLARAWLHDYGVNTDRYTRSGGDHPAMNSLPQVIAAALLAARKEGAEEMRERAAKWHDEQSEMCSHVAETTRKEWCGSDIPAEDRRANYADAREHDALSVIHGRHARAIRALPTEE